MPTLAPSPTRYLNQITRHIERTVGSSTMVFHEIISADLKLDLHVIPPPPQSQAATGDHPHGRHFFTLVTAGISAWPMTRAEGAPDAAPRHVELMVSLPADWPGLRSDGTFIQEYMCNEEHWWPVRWLKTLARLPLEHDTPLAPGRMIPQSPEPTPFAAGTDLAGIALLPSVLHPRAERLVVHDDLAIEFLALWPLHPAEMEYGQGRGMEALQAALTTAGCTDLIDPRRASVVPA